MKLINALLAGASLFASQALAGLVSHVDGTLDTTLVDPPTAQFPHFICASGCSAGAGGGGGAVTQSGTWSVGISNFPAVQTVGGTVAVSNLPSIQPISGSVTIGNFPSTQSISGTVSVAGGATAANQPALNTDGGGLAHITNFPVTQSVSGSVSIGNFPVNQTVSGTVTVAGGAIAASQPALNSDGGGLAHITNFPATQPVSGSLNIGNLPAVQAVSGSVTVAGVATVANQPALNNDGGGLAHITNFPATQPVSGSLNIGNLPAVQAVSGSVTVAGVATAANQPVLNADGGGLAHITNFPIIQPVSGSVSVGNFPSLQAVSGTVATSNGALAANQPAINADAGAQVHVMNLPALQGVGGSAGTAIGQGTAGANANSANIYMGGGINLGSAGSPSTFVESIQGVSGGNPVPVSGAFWQSTQPISISTGTLTAIVKAGGVPAAIADPALVVTLSPNNGITAYGAGGQLLMTQTGGTVGLVTSTAQIGHVVTDSGSTIAISNLPSTQATNLVDGADTTLGSKADAAWTSGSGSAISILKAIVAASQGPIPTGTSVIGKLGIDQTTPGTSNAIQPVALFPVSSSVAEACHVLKPAPGLVFNISGYMGQSEFIMLFNLPSAPADGAVTPVWWGYAGAAGAWDKTWQAPLNLSTGATVCYSSTGPFTKTALATNNAISGEVQ